jgi:hypothetical protein
MPNIGRVLEAIARTPRSTSANPNGQANQTLVPQTTNDPVPQTMQNLAQQAPKWDLDQNGNPNLNYIHPDSNSNPATTYQQHREYARSSPSSQLPSLTSANPNGQASHHWVLQTPHNLVLETTNSAPEANTLALEPNTLALEPNTLALEPNTLAPQAVTFIGVDFLNHINTSNNSDQLSMIRNDDNLDEAMGDFIFYFFIFTSNRLFNI